ncbi:hypothetical protein [Deinococcus yavapaiensis]|uniref:hypothetical protein n=1 Tax=Deinococcus yavapaiensis TaxID=309889 RepID=UPI0011B7B7B9|nr:hypothetical protein [Deinococcus yavapaiensis]
MDWSRSATHGGQVNALGTIDVTASGLREVQASKLSWRFDGAAFLYRFAECCINRVSSQPRPIDMIDMGENLLETPGFLGKVAYAPTKARAQEFLYTSCDPLEGASIMLGAEGQRVGEELLTANTIYSVAWLPDASGFVYTKDGLDEHGPTRVNSNVWLDDFKFGRSRHSRRVRVSRDGLPGRMGTGLRTRSYRGTGG